MDPFFHLMDDRFNIFWPGRCYFGNHIGDRVREDKFLSMEWLPGEQRFLVFKFAEIEFSVFYFR